MTAELNAYGNVVVIPNDLLLFLPFHALTRRAPDGADRFLAETHAVSYVTQLELTDALSREPSASSEGALLAVANPDGSLPGASQEVRAVVRLRKRATALEGAQATKTKFFELVANVTDVHLATHGELDTARPHESYLLFAGQGKEEQRLSIGEIAGLSLEPRSLVVLSACETAVGEQVPGAALITLAAAFSQAGAQSVVASLWRVNDAAARDFMVSFHERLRVTDRGGALHGAQVSVLRSPRTRHPFYWAPFVLIGHR